MIRKLVDPVRGILWGGVVTILVFFPLMAIEIGFFGFLDLHPNLKTYSWLIAVSVGGYFACRQAKTSPWVNWAIFAVLLELLVVGEIPTANKSLSELYPNADPATVQWHYRTMLMLTIPAALLGGVLWARSNKDTDERSRHEEEGELGR